MAWCSSCCGLAGNPFFIRTTAKHTARVRVQHACSDVVKDLIWDVSWDRQSLKTVVPKSFEVQRVSDRIILVKLVVGQCVVTFLSVYALQSGVGDEVKDLFFDQLRAVTARILASEFLIPSGDWNGHVGRAGTGYTGKCMVGWGMAGQNQMLRVREP